MREIGWRKGTAVSQFLDGKSGASVSGIFSQVPIKDSDVMNILEGAFSQPDWLHLPQGFSKWAKKRALEYVAGRKAAAQAMQVLGLDALPVVSNLDRSPKWPVDMKASLSHNSQRAICLMLNSSATVSGVGVDVENRQAVLEHIPDSALIINEKESSVMLDSGLSFEDALALIFSMKESLFKAVYPNCGHYFDFLDAQVEGIDVLSKTGSGNTERLYGRVSLRLLTTLNAQLRRGQDFTGEFQFIDQDVLTSLIY